MDPGSMAIIWLLLATVSLLVALGMYSWRSLRRWRASRLAWLLRAPACLGREHSLTLRPRCSILGA
jgi:type II secretory pathway component PulF